MAVWHGEFAIQEQLCLDDFVLGALTNAMPCSCCPDEHGVPCCVKFGVWFGVCCSLPTLCLSWIPCYIIAAHTAVNLSDTNNDLGEKAAEEAAEKALDRTKKVLIKGPAGRFKNVLTQDQTVSNPVQ